MEVTLRLLAIDGGTGYSTYEGKQAHKQAGASPNYTIESKKANGWFEGRSRSTVRDRVYGIKNPK